jgi:hypothetical protein
MVTTPMAFYDAKDRKKQEKECNCLKLIEN